MDALAVNGISSELVQILPQVTLPSGATIKAMLINQWSFGKPSYSSSAPWIYQFTSVVESTGGLGMVPLPSGSVFGNITSNSGLPGQNSTTPSEKFFGNHYIVKAPPNLIDGDQYFDPSYGVTYTNNCTFEQHAVAGYATQFATDQNTPNFHVELPTGACSVSFSQ